MGGTLGGRGDDTLIFLKGFMDSQKFKVGACAIKMPREGFCFTRTKLEQTGLFLRYAMFSAVFASVFPRCKHQRI